MKYCKRVFEGLYCMPGGDVSLCSWTDAVIGNIFEENLEHIWNSELAEKVRISIKDGSFRYCRKTSCPYLENDTLPEISTEELIAQTSEPWPTDFNLANSIICNHSCPSCRDKILNVDQGYLEKLKEYLKILFPYINKAKHINLNGAGEVFANPIMLEMLEKLNPEHPDFNLSLETNGALFTRKNWDKIKHLSKYPISVAVTPNSFVRATHAYLAGGHNDYDHVIENMYFIKELRQKKLIQRYEISIVVQDRNFQELPEFIERCVNDFEADKVTIKPLYKWFYMSEELYWFKDILNPYHPYHKEYLNILNNPILDHPKVYLWGAKNLHKAKLHPAYKYRDLLRIAKELMLISDAGRKQLADIVKNNNLIVYGDNELSYIICKVLEDSGSKVQCIMARDFSCESNAPHGIRMENFWEYSPSANDILLISNYYDRKYIERDLTLKKFNGQLLDIEEVLKLIKKDL